MEKNLKDSTVKPNQGVEEVVSKNTEENDNIVKSKPSEETKNQCTSSENPLKKIEEALSEGFKDEDSSSKLTNVEKIPETEKWGLSEGVKSAASEGSKDQSTSSENISKKVEETVKDTCAKSTLNEGLLSKSTDVVEKVPDAAKCALIEGVISKAIEGSKNEHTSSENTSKKIEETIKDASKSTVNEGLSSKSTALDVEKIPEAAERELSAEGLKAKAHKRHKDTNHKICEGCELEGIDEISSEESSSEGKKKSVSQNVENVAKTVKSKVSAGYNVLKRKLTGGYQAVKRRLTSQTPKEESKSSELALQVNSVPEESGKDGTTGVKPKQDDRTTSSLTSKIMEEKDKDVKTNLNERSKNEGISSEITSKNAEETPKKDTTLSERSEDKGVSSELNLAKK